MRRAGGESGFALLLVFALASIIAITLYIALPRVAFESERDREELLIQRGEQYSRAIQLYVRKNKRFPGRMEDLENTNGVRFLRRQYVDPMTGKNEWRLLHAGPGGQLIDSLVQTQTKKETKVVDNFIAELPTVGSAPGAAGENVNPALRHRPSDQAGAPGGLNAGPIPPDPGLAAGGPTNPPPGTLPVGPTGANPNLPGRVGQPQPTAPASGISTLPSFGGGAAPVPGQIPGQVPGQLPAQIAQQLNNPTGQLPGGGGPPNEAARLIQGLLTTPRPGGLAGLQGGLQQPGQQIVGGGIAGVASNYKGSGIKLYHDQEEFPKWEFVYDLSKDKTMNPAANLPQAGAVPGTPIGAVPGTTPGSNPGSAPGTPGNVTPQGPLRDPVTIGVPIK